MKTQSTCPKNRFSNFFWAATLLLAVFSFSGYAGNSKSQQQQTTKIELVFTHNFKTWKRIISYKKYIAPTPEYCPSNKFKECEKQALSVYNKLTKVKFNGNARKLYFIKPALHFFQLKTISKNSITEYPSAMV